MTIGYSNLGNYGRMGNQMFQYAALRGIAKARGFDWVVPTQEKFKGTYHSTSNIFECFALEEARSNMTDVEFERLVEESSGTNKMDPLILYACEDNSDLLGYFHSPKYFENCEDEIKKEFSIIDESKPINIDEYISIHVRRDDYVGWFEQICPQQTFNYYDKALSLFDKSLPVIVSSDDIDWCKTVFLSDRFVFSNHDPYETMSVMKNASANIISNSTFAWWGAYLADHENVVIPKKWYGPAAPNHSGEEYLMNGWKQC